MTSREGERKRRKEGRKEREGSEGSEGREGREGGACDCIVYLSMMDLCGGLTRANS